jgi:hypothetical protein
MRHLDEATGSPTSGRVARRHKLFEPVDMIVDGIPVRAHLLNISATGALVHSAAIPAAGASVQLMLDGSKHAAHVMWRAAPRFGVSFGSRLSDTALQTILRPGK